MRNSKKVLSVLLVVAMMLTMFSFTAFAGEIGTQNAENAVLSSVLDKNLLDSSDSYFARSGFLAIPTENESETPDEGKTYTYHFRVIGGKDTSSSGLNFENKYGDYCGGEYQNWYKTTDLTTTGTLIGDVINAGMAQSKLTCSLQKSATSVSVTAPVEYGGHTLKRDRNKYNYLRWGYTILDAEGKTVKDGIIQTSLFSDTEIVVPDGATVIVHCCYDYRYELLASSTYWEEGKTDGYLQYYLKTPDFTFEEYNEVVSVQNQIASLENVRLTPDSKELVESVRNSYEALSDVQKESVTNLNVLESTEKELEYILGNLATTKLPAPVMNASATSDLYSASVSANDLADEYDGCYSIVYSMSVDGKNWGAWQGSGTFEKLLPAETYYVRAMAQTEDWTAYIDSEPSKPIEVKTTGGDVTPIPVTTYTELQLAMQSADTTGALTVIDVKNDIVLNDIQGERFRFEIPSGANVVLTGSNGSRFFMNESSGGSGIILAADSVLTVKDLTVGHQSEYRTGRTTLHPNNDWAHTFQLMSASAVLNLDSSVYYGDTAAVMVNGKGTVNIYSGSYNAIGRSTNSGYPRYKLMTDAVVNLIPTGDIALEGPFNNIANVNLNWQLSSPAGGTTGLDNVGLSTLSAAELYSATSMAYGEGLRIFTPENKTVTPLSDIVVLPADDENAASADVTYTVGDNQIEFTKKDRANAVFQIIHEIGRGADICSSESNDNNGIGNIFTYDNLTKDTEYKFTITYHTLSAAYADVTKEVTIKTTYTPVVLDAPVLTDLGAEMIDKSITLGTPDACAVEEANASLLYRMSEDNEVWGEWQESNVFEGLKANTKYYFQAMYKVGAEGEKVHLYSDSPESNTLELTTAMPALAAPVLTGDAVATLTSITLPAAPACAEDETAVAQYAISTDGETWSDWQASNVFDKLSPGTEYQFKVRYYTTNVAWLNSDYYTAPEVVTYSTLVSKVVVSDAEERSGKEVSVTISLENNPGIIGLELSLNYDQNKLELVKAEDSGNFKLSDENADFTCGNDLTAVPFKLMWDVEGNQNSPENYAGNDKLATLTFKIKESCSADDVIAVDIEVKSAYNFDLDNQVFQVQNGKITVVERFWGEPEYVWADDYSTCTAKRTCCEECGDVKTEEETVESSVVTDEYGTKTYTAEFVNAAFVAQSKVVKLENVTVTFRLIGATKSSAPIDYKTNPGDSHGSEYATWIATKTYELKNGSSVYDLFLKVAEENDLTYKGSDAYISSITAPKALGGYELAGSTNGRNSGWMYTVNDEHTQYTIGEQVLRNNDAVVFHYVNDYRTEESAFPWLEAEDVVTPIVKDPSELPFTDLTSPWYKDAVAYVYSYDLMIGTGDGTTFSPDGKLSRAMMATILYRMEGSPKVSAENPFTDVETGKWYTDAVIWAAENEVVYGVGGNKFAPNDNITREQMAVMMSRYAKYKGESVTPTGSLAAFPDNGEVSSWAKDPMTWVVDTGLIVGTMKDGVTYLAPKGEATRAMAATVLMRFHRDIL